MSKNLVIVESPAKAKTIEKYLGKDYTVLASYGHVRDLVPKTGAVNPDENFSMRYEVIERNAKHVDKIIKALKKADNLLLATDPDREGEAISWHLMELLKEKKKLKDKKIERVVFHEITKTAVKDAIDNPRTLSDSLISAQQARRALDYLVGFNLSPLLWKKIRRGLSAGRVQSPALRMIVEREKEIEAFNPKEYWSIDTELNKDKQTFTAKLNRYNNEKVKQFTITSAEQAKEAHDNLVSAANGQLTVDSVTRKKRKRNPVAPFITSTLQQEASRKLGFPTYKTMQLAQQLYEGIDLGSGPVGLITYMRTDSVNLAAEAVENIRNMIQTSYGKDYVPETQNVYKTKSKNAQEAHEAIRPTDVLITPKEAKQALTKDQHRLYDLIWKRTVASQMIYATLNTVSVELACGKDHSFRATGSSIQHAGFMKIYLEGDDETKNKESDEKFLPEMKEGETVPLKDIVTKQHFTEPPPRYSEASLVKSLEEHGIGRPSTYASIISTLINREYVELESRRFTPTEVGKVVNNFLTAHFSDYVDYDFTARLEDELDEVSRGEKEWLPVMEAFWKPFTALIDEKTESVSREEAVQSRDLGEDPKSGRPISVRMGRYGPFVQIGRKEDEEKPLFAGLRPGQKMDSIELEDALELFKLPRKLGKTEEDEDVSTNFGRFGPYVKYGSKYVSIKDDDPHTITLEKALELIKEKKEADANKIIQDYPDEGIQVLNGRYGPYITDGKKNAKIPKDVEPTSLTLEVCQELIAAAPEKKARGKRKAPAKKKEPAEKKTAAKKKAPAKKKTTAKKKAPAKKKTS